MIFKKSKNVSSGKGAGRTDPKGNGLPYKTPPKPSGGGNPTKGTKPAGGWGTRGGPNS